VFAPPLQVSRAELVTELWRQVEDAVDARIDRGGHTAIIMSGGVDSSCVGAAASRRLKAGDRLTGYSAVFPGYPEIDESPRIKVLTDALQLRTVQLRFRAAGVVRTAVEFVSRWETGFPGPGYLLEHELLKRAALDGATIALDGQRGDETFGLWPFAPSDLLLKGRIIASVQALQRFPGGSGRTGREIGRAWRDVALRGAIPHRLHAALRRRARPSAHVRPWVKPEWAQLYLQSSDRWSWKRQPAPRSWAHASDRLVGPSRAGAAEYLRQRSAPYAIEARPPLLDVDLVEFVLRMPSEAAFDPFTDRPLIREAMIHLVPDSVRLHRPKSNLAPFYFDGVLADLHALRRLLGCDDARIFEYVERPAVHELVRRPPSREGAGWAPWLTDIWNIAGLEVWLRHQEDERAVDRILHEWDLSHPTHEVLQQQAKTPTAVP
jgi:asparagine synthetase B (glutamine-hydrolysing)